MHLLQVMNLIGDVRGKVAVMMDDMIDTAGTSSPRNQFLDWTFFSPHNGQLGHEFIP